MSCFNQHNAVQWIWIPFRLQSDIHLCFITSPGKTILYITHMCGSYILSVPHRMLIWFSGLKSTKYNQMLLKSHYLLTFSIVYGQFWPEVLWCSQNSIIYAYEYDQLGDVEWVAVERLKSAYIIWYYSQSSAIPLMVPLLLYLLLLDHTLLSSNHSHCLTQVHQIWQN